MSSEIIVALFSLCGTLVGSVAGILASSKLTRFRLEQLEKKVEKHNTLVERLTRAELAIARIDEIIKTKEGKH